MIKQPRDETLGQMLVRERAAGTAWKILMRRTGLSRSRLNEILRAETDDGKVDKALDQLLVDIRTRLQREGCVEIMVNGQTACVLLEAVVLDFPTNVSSGHIRAGVRGGKSLLTGRVTTT